MSRGSSDGDGVVDSDRTTPSSTLRFDHIGIVVTELAVGLPIFRDRFNVRHWTQPFTDPVNDVYVQFGRDAQGVCYELVAPLSKDSPVRRALRTGQNITNHLAYLVAELAATREIFIAADFSPIAEPKPAIAYGGRLIQFFMSPIFSLVELIEAPEHLHLYVDV